MEIVSYIAGCSLVAATLIAGILFRFFPPRRISLWYGYRTAASMRNQQTWNYAHRICSLVFLAFSLLSVPAYALILILAKNYLDTYPFVRMIIGMVVMLVGFAIACVITEMKTKHRFGQTDLSKTPEPQ